MRIAPGVPQSLFLFTLAVGGCGHPHALVPAESAEVVSGAREYARASDAGVTLSATGARWDGRPEDLPRRATPLRVRLRNGSPVPLRISYESFALVGKRGRSYPALPPFPVAASGEAERLRPAYSSNRFFVAKRCSPYYSGAETWPAALPPRADESLYERWPEELPTREMRRRALAEGVLQPGGIVTGYVYFEKATDRESRVALQATLANMMTGEDYASFDIPFKVE